MSEADAALVEVAKLDLSVATAVSVAMSTPVETLVNPRQQIDMLLAALGNPDAPHDPALHEGADPLDADMSYCPVCSAIVALRRLRETL